MRKRGDVLICRKHGAVMPIVPGSGLVRSPLRRCAKCTDEFRAAWAKAVSHYRPGRVGKQHNLPPVFMPERWL